MAETAVRTKTAYHVLQLVSAELKRDDVIQAPENWNVYARDVEANSAPDAVRKTVKDGGMYVAVPSRSFSPTTVKIETQTVVKLE